MTRLEVGEPYEWDLEVALYYRVRQLVDVNALLRQSRMM